VGKEKKSVLSIDLTSNDLFYKAAGGGEGVGAPDVLTRLFRRWQKNGNVFGKFWRKYRSHWSHCGDEGNVVAYKLCYYPPRMIWPI
jgi:hypothetical protein